MNHEGYWTALNRRRLWPKILDTPPVHTDTPTPDSDLCVHLMCYAGDYLCAIWALKSFYHHAGNPYPLCVHVQGESTPVLEGRLRAHFPNARLILQAEADQIVEPYLRERNWTNLLKYRKALPTVQKLTDFLILAQAHRIVIFDSDVLFFQNPVELTSTDSSQDGLALFQRDYIDAYSLSLACARSDFGIDLQPSINVGMVRLSPDVIDLANCEAYLAHPAFADFEGHTEQTLWALEVSRTQSVTYLPPSYLLSLETKVDYNTLKARHYAGPTRVLLTRQGIPQLIQRGFLQSLKNGTAEKAGCAPAPKI